MHYWPQRYVLVIGQLHSPAGFPYWYPPNTCRVGRTARLDALERRKVLTYTGIKLWFVGCPARNHWLYGLTVRLSALMRSTMKVLCAIPELLSCQSGLDNPRSKPYVWVRQTQRCVRSYLAAGCYSAFPRNNVTQDVAAICGWRSDRSVFMKNSKIKLTICLMLLKLQFLFTENLTEGFCSVCRIWCLATWI
jgi:hypothetical protein